MSDLKRLRQEKDDLVVCPACDRIVGVHREKVGHCPVCKVTIESTDIALAFVPVREAVWRGDCVQDFVRIAVGYRLAALARRGDDVEPDTVDAIIRAVAERAGKGVAFRTILVPFGEATAVSVFHPSGPDTFRRIQDEELEQQMTCARSQHPDTEEHQMLVLVDEVGCRYTLNSVGLLVAGFRAGPTGSA